MHTYVYEYHQCWTVYPLEFHMAQWVTEVVAIWTLYIPPLVYLRIQGSCAIMFYVDIHMYVCVCEMCVCMCVCIRTLVIFVLEAVVYRSSPTQNK